MGWPIFRLSNPILGCFTCYEGLFRQNWSVGTFHRASTLPVTDHFSGEEKPGNDSTVTGFDFLSQWPEEMQIILEHGPSTADELKKLPFQQMTDNWYVTSWILPQEGKDVFVASQQEFRGLLLRRLERGERLDPTASE